MDLLVLEPWRPPFDVGLAFNRTAWEKIESFSAQYCMFNDRSWSYSLSNLIKQFPRGYASMVACVTPRVLSTKEFVRPNVALQKFLTSSSAWIRCLITPMRTNAMMTLNSLAHYSSDDV
ncbi:jg1423 [Pararge aegeria aegeria]|uniref:Jg1423 protein n=1 Tax=Pararge aegeria aegeria TaxID=348720 RepID=A0A8S4RQ53_9NEOP|nr:jg1423 [Pararge aegeria aegeria]